MKFLHLASALLLLSVFFSSCSKDNDDINQPPAVCKITAFNDQGVVNKVHYSGDKIDYITSSYDSTTFEYNSNGRIITRSEFTPPTALYPNEKFTFEYNGDNIVKENCYQFIDLAEPARLSRQAIFTYTAGKPSSMKLVAGTMEEMDTYHFTWTNGNITSVNNVSADGTYSVTYSYQFDVTRENYFTKYYPNIFILWPHHIPEMYDQFFSKNLITRSIGTDGLPNDDVKHITNAAGNITEVEWLGRVTKITYECP